MAQRPRLLLIDPVFHYPWTFRAALRVGVDLVAVVPSLDEQAKPDLLPEAVKDVVVAPIRTDPDAALDELARLHAAAPYGGVMPGKEAAVSFTARAARRLGLPGLSEQATATVRDKREMRRRLRAAGLATPDFRTIPAPDRWRDALALRFPVVVKPADGYSSLGVVRVDSPDELEAAVAQTWRLGTARLARDAARDEGILVEEYLDGPEISADSLAYRGEVKVCAISYKGELTGPYFQEISYRAPAQLPTEVLAAIEAEVVGAHRAFGVTDGPTHTELRIVGGTRPVLLEMAARMGGGGSLHHLVSISAGIDLAGDALRSYLGREPLCWSATRQTHGTGYAASYSMPVGRGGRIARIRGLEQVRADPRVDDVVQTVFPGEVIRPYPDFSGYPAMVMSHHPSDADVVAFHRELDRTLRVEFED